MTKKYFRDNLPDVLVDPVTGTRYTVDKPNAREKHPGHLTVYLEDLRTAEQTFADRDENWNFCGKAQPNPKPLREK